MKPRTAPRHTELEAAIEANPTLDAPHLVYADWLEAQGDARRALALRVLGGQSIDSDEARDAGRLALAVSRWLAGEQVDWDDERTPRSVDEVRALRRGGLLTPFLHAWGSSSPFEKDETLRSAFEENAHVSPKLARPRDAMLEDVAFEHVPVNQNGTIGISGALLLSACDGLTAFDVLAAHLTGRALDALRGAVREEAIDDATDWTAVSRAQAYGTLFNSLASNEGHGVKRGEAEVELVELLETLGPMQSAAFTQTEFTWMLMQFERGWLAFYVTF